MTRVKMMVAVALGTALLSSAATAGGVICMLQGRNVTIGKTASAPEGGLCKIAGSPGQALKVGPQTSVVRLERVAPGEIRPGEQFVALNGEKGGASPCVVLYRSDRDLFDVYRAFGHGTRAPAATAAARK